MGEKKIQFGIGFGKKILDDTEFRDSLDTLDDNLKGIDTDLRDIETKLDKL